MNPNESFTRPTPLDLAAMRLVEAHDAGDLEALAALWASAARDPVLGEHLTRVEAGLLAEMDAVGEVETIRLTAADIADRLRLAEKRRAPEETRVIDRLAACEEELPDSITMKVVRGLWEKLGLGASGTLAREFLENATALLLGTGGQQRVALMAARAVRKGRKKLS